MSFDLNVVVTGLAAPVAVLFVKTLLDFSLAHVFVKYFWWLPVRGLFRDNPSKISGKWLQCWGAAGSDSFSEESSRTDETVLRQFGRYCLAEFHSKGVKYRLFGKIKNSYLIGEWYDIDQKTAYFGAFQLRIVDSSTLEGVYVGHSRNTSKVQQDSWKWSRQ